VVDDLYKKAGEILVKQRQCVALTGAGISAESGIDTFRSKGGLWEKYDPMISFLIIFSPTAIADLKSDVRFDPGFPLFLHR
jgi:NAD-dependent SIR2 family protein deacetylase